MLIKEYQIPVPFTPEEYQKGCLYTIAKWSNLSSNTEEGIELISSEPFSNKELFGGKYKSGWYTKKIYRMASKVPFRIRRMAKDCVDIVEISWDAYPYSKTILRGGTSGPLKDYFHCTIETFVQAGSERVQNLLRTPEGILDRHEIVVVDFVNNPLEAEDFRDEKENPLQFRSEKLDRGPLAKNWLKTFSPITTVYKLVSVKFDWPTLDEGVPKYFHDLEQQFLITLHRKMFCWMDEWYEMSQDEIRNFENSIGGELNQKRAVAEAAEQKAKEEAAQKAKEEAEAKKREREEERRRNTRKVVVVTGNPQDYPYKVYERYEGPPEPTPDEAKESTSENGSALRVVLERLAVIEKIRMGLYFPKGELTTFGEENASVSEATPSTSRESKALMTGEVKASMTGEAGASTTSEAEASTSGGTKKFTTGGTKESTTGGNKESTTGVTKESTTGKAKASTTGKAKASTIGKAKSSTTGNAKSSTIGKAKSSTIGKAKSSTIGKAKASTIGKAKASTTGKAKAATTGEAEASTTGEVKTSSTGEDSRSSSGEDIHTLSAWRKLHTHYQGYISKKASSEDALLRLYRERRARYTQLPESSKRVDKSASDILDESTSEEEQ